MIDRFQIFLKTKVVVWLKKWKKLLLGVFLLTIISYESQLFFRSFNLAETVKLIRSLAPITVVIFLIAGVFTFGLTFLYDFTVSRRLNVKIPFFRLLKVSWIANAFNNVTGAFPAGIGIRMLLYHRNDVEDEDINKMNMLILPATITGLGMLMLFDLIGYGGTRLIVKQHWWLMLLIVGNILFIPIYCWFTDVKLSKFKIQITHNPNSKETITRVLLTMVSTLDWAMASLMFWIVARFIYPEITIFMAISIYSVATAVGIASMIPAGIGSFDLLVLSGLQLHGATPGEALAVLVLFRIFYNLIPLMLGAILSISEFSQTIYRFRKKVMSFTFFSKDVYTVPSGKKTNQIIGDYAHKLLSVMVVIGGLMLVLSASTPGIPTRIHFLVGILSIPILQISHRISLFIGLIILLISNEILSKVRKAWSTALILLGLGAIFTFFKGMDFEEAIYLLVTFMFLLLSRPVFYRKSSPLSIGKYILGGLFAFGGTGFYIVSGQSALQSSQNKLSFLNFTQNDFVINGLIALTAALAIYFLWRKSLPGPDFPPSPTSKHELDRVEVFLSSNYGNENSHLIFTGDKKLFWACNDEVLIAYQVSDKYLVVLGEPSGKKELLKSALNEFEFYALSYGYWPCFYQISEQFMALLHEYGYDFFKLGEEAVVDLEDFDIALPQNRDIRNVKSRIEREGYFYEMITNSETIENNLPEIRRVSESWLNQRKEKRFSLGFFDESYLKRSPVALVKDAQGTIIAFANLMPSYQGNEKISVDLMRHIPNGPNGMMDYLFLNLFLWSKQKGYKEFSLGMVPLFNVGSTLFSRNIEAAAAILYQRGNQLYSFVGLFKYKNKFKPEWHSKYLAFHKENNLVAVIVNIIKLIN